MSKMQRGPNLDKYIEAIDRVSFEKQRMLIVELKEYLRMQGWSYADVDDYVRDNRVSMKIRRNPQLVQHKGKPDKLKKAIENIQ